MNTPQKDDKKVPTGKKEAFEPPKVVDIEGKEVAAHLKDADLEHASGSGHLCLGGGLAN